MKIKGKTLVVRGVYGGVVEYNTQLCLMYTASLFSFKTHIFFISFFYISILFYINIFFCSWKTFSFSLLLLFCFLISTFFPCVFPPFTQNTQSKNSRRDRWDGERVGGFGNSFVLCLVECEKMENNKKM